MTVIQTETQTEMVVTGGVFKILVMDDEAILLNAVGEMLKYYGHRVVLTNDGVKAIELYKQAKLLGEPFDVIIVDLTIPGGMGGRRQSPISVISIRRSKRLSPTVTRLIPLWRIMSGLVLWVWSVNHIKLMS